MENDKINIDQYNAGPILGEILKNGDFADVLGDPVIRSTVEIVIRPEANPAIISLKAEIVKLGNYAQARVIAQDEDLPPANDDISLIAKLKKAIKEKQAEYCDPVKAQLDAMKAIFKDLTDILELADATNRQKVNAYRAAQIARQAEAERLNREALELARKQAEFSGTGEHTVDLTPLEAPPPVAKIQSDMGTTSFRKNWVWAIEDRAKIPSDYMIVDAGRITKEVKAGVRSIPGVRIYCEEIIQNRTR